MKGRIGIKCKIAEKWKKHMKNQLAYLQGNMTCGIVSQMKMLKELSNFQQLHTKLETNID